MTNNPLEEMLSKKESRVYESILDFPRYIMNEILAEWKPYQALTRNDKRRRNVMRYINAKWRIDDLKGYEFFRFTVPDDVVVRETKFANKTIYLVKGVTRNLKNRQTTSMNEKMDENIMLYSFLEDGTKNKIILYVDPIIDLYKFPRTIVSKDLKSFDKEWRTDKVDRNLFSWYYKIFSDLKDLVFILYETYPTYDIGNDMTIDLNTLLVYSAFVWYYSFEEDLRTKIVTVENKRTNYVTNYNTDVLMILKSLHIYRTILNDIKHNVFNDTILKDEELDEVIINIIKFSKLFTTDKFNNADVLLKSGLIKEKELEIKHG